MKSTNRLAIASVVGFLLSSSAMAAQQQPAVAKLLQVSGKALVETVDGKRQVAKKGMKVSEGSHIVVLEKSKITMGYLSSECQVVHQQNTLLTVQEAEQCGAGQPIAVGAAGAAAVPPKTIAAGKTAAIPPIMKGMGFGSGSLGTGAMGAATIPLLALGGVAIAAAINDDDDDDVTAPVTTVSNFFDGNGNPVPVNAAGQPLDANGNAITDPSAAPGLFNADGAVVNAGGNFVSDFVDGNGNTVPVNAAGQPFDANGNVVADNNTNIGLFSPVGAVVDAGGDPISNVTTADGTVIPVNAAGVPIDAQGNALFASLPPNTPIIFISPTGVPVTVTTNPDGGFTLPNGNTVSGDNADDAITQIVTGTDPDAVGMSG